MRVESTKTLYLTKAEKKVLTDFYWNFHDDDLVDEMYDTLKALAEDMPRYTSCEIEITD